MSNCDHFKTETTAERCGEKAVYQVTGQNSRESLGTVCYGHKLSMEREGIECSFNLIRAN